MNYEEGLMLDGRYLLKKKIGGGSFGEVWSCMDTKTDLEVAVKIYISMDSQGFSDFQQEFQLSFELNHTNLLHANFLGISQEDNRPYLVMPLCPQGSVSKHSGTISEDELWKFVRDVASGLAYLHGQDPAIIHQDIKPDNILILKDGTYVITDFGISKQLRRSLRKSSQFSSAGAISYMGPERFSKQYQAVKSSDIWSFGVTIYELAAGELPFCGMGGSMQKQGAEIPDLPEKFSPRLNNLVKACLQAETWDRPTAEQLAFYADSVCRGREVSAPWEPDGTVAAVSPVSSTPSSSPSHSTSPAVSSISAGGNMRQQQPAIIKKGTPKTNKFKCLACKTTFYDETGNPSVCPVCGSENLTPYSRNKAVMAGLIIFIAVIIIGLAYGAYEMFFTGRQKIDDEKTQQTEIVQTTYRPEPKIEEQPSEDKYPVISDVSSPVLKNGKYSFSVNASGDDLEYLLYDSSEATLLETNSGGVFSDIDPVAGGVYKLVVRNRLKPQLNTGKMLTGFDIPVKEKPAVAKISKEQIQATINSGNMDQSLYNVSRRCRVNVTNLAPDDIAPRNISEVINNLPSPWKSVTVESVSYDEQNYIKSITISVIYDN